MKFEADPRGGVIGQYIPRANGAAQDNSMSSRKMKLEWFNEACALALCSDEKPLIVNLLDNGAMSVIYGESNSGKTFAVLDKAFCVGTGLPWNGHNTEQGLVVYVAAEGGRRITRRLAAIRKRYIEDHGKDAPEPLLALIRFPIDLRNGDSNLKELLEKVREAEEACGEKCVWIIVDTLSRALAGGDENSSVDMGTVVKAADIIRAETGAHFTYVHHTGKDTARGARGHSLLRAATDTEIEVAPQLITVTKQRDMDGGQKFGFTLVDVEIGVDTIGLPVTSAVVEWCEAKTTKPKAGDTVPKQKRLLIEVLDEAIADAGKDVRPSADGPMVRAVSEDIVRGRYYARIAEDPPEDDTPKKLKARQRAAFGLAIKGLIDAKLLLATSVGGRRLLWRA
jgi:hypothetical protein